MHHFRALSKSVVSQDIGKTLWCNIAMSYTAQTKHSNFVDKAYTFDEDSYPFVVNMGTTFHIYKDRELYTRSITNAQHIIIKGVGGWIKVRCHGIIKIRVVDSMNDACDLIITDILYVPESLTNLLSHQLWLELAQNPVGTGGITIGDTTLLFWDNNTHNETITHHPHLKLLIFHTNGGRTMANLINKGCQVLPQISRCLNILVSMISSTSNGENNTYAIPLDDDEC